MTCPVWGQVAFHKILWQCFTYATVPSFAMVWYQWLELKQRF
jgi:hypothetical protein